MVKAWVGHRSLLCVSLYGEDWVEDIFWGYKLIWDALCRPACSYSHSGALMFRLLTLSLVWAAMPPNPLGRHMQWFSVHHTFLKGVPITIISQIDALFLAYVRLRFLARPYIRSTDYECSSACRLIFSYFPLYLRPLGDAHFFSTDSTAFYFGLVLLGRGAVIL